jgi:hypothetical protein
LKEVFFNEHQKLIASAKTFEEINRIELLLKTGEIDNSTFFDQTLKKLKK